MIKKIKWIAGFAIIFLLILATNLLDRREFKAIRESVTTIYESRLVAQDLIFKMSLLLEKKSVAVAAGDATFFAAKNNEVNAEIKELIKKLEITKLTNREEKNLVGFTDHFQNLLETEQQFVDKTQGSLSQQARVMLVSPIAELNRELYVLSKIQMEEGQREMRRATESANKVSSLANVEVIFLIIIGLVIQVIILLPNATIEDHSAN